MACLNKDYDDEDADDQAQFPAHLYLIELLGEAICDRRTIASSDV